MTEKRKGLKFAFTEADPDKIIVSMLEFQGNIYVATQKGIYILTEGDTLVRLELVDKTSSPAPLQAPESPVEA